MKHSARAASVGLVLIRYFAEVSGTATGKVARVWAERLHATGRPVRLISATSAADLTREWKPFVGLMSTPMQPEFINVVCCNPNNWTWVVKVGEVPDAKTQRIAPGSAVMPVLERLQLYTAKVRNVLLVPPGAHLTGNRGKVISAGQIASALQYEALVVDQADAGWWMGLAPKYMITAQNERALDSALA
jgi:hypothetical protein